MNPGASRDIERILRDGPALDRALLSARRRVILRHRQLGVPLVIWRDGAVVEISPETVDLPEGSGAPDSTAMS